MSQRKEAIKSLRAAQANIATKINDLDFERSEHIIVLEELYASEKRESSGGELKMESQEMLRPCYRLVSNVLVKKTLGEIVSELKESIKSMESLTQALKERSQKYSEELEKMNDLA